MHYPGVDYITAQPCMSRSRRSFVCAGSVVFEVDAPSLRQNGEKDREGRKEGG